jgi:hypothetical protein
MKILSIMLDKPLQLDSQRLRKEGWNSDEADIVVSGDWVIILGKRESRAFAVHGSRLTLVLDPNDAREMILDAATAPAPKRKVG